MRGYKFYLICSIIFLVIISCEEDENYIGGSTDLELTKVGNVTTVYTDLSQFIPGLSDLSMDFVIEKNERGIVTYHSSIVINEQILRNAEKLLGLDQLSGETKKYVSEKIAKSFGLTIDSTDKNNIKVDINIKAKVTSEGIQDFVHSQGNTNKPFTVVKYDAKVGDKYNFVDSDGSHFQREVTYRSKTDDYPMGFWFIKVIKVEETEIEGRNKELFGKITYYTNHKFGLVGMEWTKPDGQKLSVGLIPPVTP